jgi:hypothetical protein
MKIFPLTDVITFATETTLGLFFRQPELHASVHEAACLYLDTKAFASVASTASTARSIGFSV